ncbi:hypothetical protein CTZ27_20885 [Streptomyces griseocarneus]|nr:hypothetical protein CTZ27_20885 [Streptomyces griseocarneus]
MRITITKILDIEAKKVEFTCAAGSSWGRWRGEEAPELGVFDVELEIGEEVEQWFPAPSPAEEIDAGGPDAARSIALSGVVERVDDDSVLTLRIQKDLVTIELAGRDRPSQGDGISLKVKNLDIYPYWL